MTTRPTLSEIEAKSLANRAAHAPRRVNLLDGRSPLDKPEKPERRGRKRRLTLLEKRAIRHADKFRLSESGVLNACALILEMHPAVAFWWRQNTGVGKFGDRYVKFSFKGASDLMAVLKSGARFVACECKATGEKPSEDQENFLANVNEAGGLGVWCDDPAILSAALDGLGRA